MKLHNKLFEANIFGVWTEGSVFIFKNRRTEDRCELTISEVMDLGHELIEWAVRLNGDEYTKETK